MGLFFNLELANWAKSKTKLLVPFSTNKGDKTVEQEILLGMVRRKHPRVIKQQIANWDISPNASDQKEDNRNHLIRFTDGWDQEHIDTLGQFSNWINGAEKKSPRGYHNDGSYRTVLSDLENNCRNSVKYGIGNCDELSGIAFLLLLEYPQQDKNIRIEKINITHPGDHCFVIIGRRKNSDIRDPRTWGPDAVICDPWGNANLAVREQLNKPRANRIGIFNYILDSLAHRDFSFKAIDDQVGMGHTNRWKRKGREDLRLSRNYCSKGQNLPFFNPSMDLDESESTGIRHRRRARTDEESLSQRFEV